ncbi:ATP phosphoribosyltransferase regulatory subunit [Caldicellulosiruptor naganoensis]|uniref:ATP phosphoribosyltransferase regulatory subunit n=1 Tax=Caldicellulosiruptor naganoensis TaxID=29324 RepID=A0ABY7BCF0_9FIRM|nr:ATP phosphoribosyltransferase regulatory subunit [Caldicellulosiruptor naganoensis]WAM30492.1 ATP phosphoribosyltransferase regulatory subunit [Caldicellulosiruptor naganoensis]
MNKKFVDYYPLPANLLEQIRKKTLSLFVKFGYQLVEPSTFEDYEKSKSLDGQNTIKFMDADGSIIALRNEFTPKVAEIAAKRFEEIYPIKYCYFGRAYQFLQHDAGDLREFFQAGIENFHISDSIYIDLEVLILAVESLLQLGFDNFTIDIGEVNFFKGITTDYGIDDFSSEMLCKLVDKKDYIGIENFLIKKGISEKVIDIFRNLTKLYGKKDKIDEAYNFAKNEISKSAIDRLKEIYEKMSKLGYEKYISVDFGMVKHLNYYTGIIFSGYLPKLGYPILNGGRYDNLCEKFGKKLYAIGFALGVDRLVKWLLKNTDLKISFYKSAMFYSKGFFEVAIRELLKFENEVYFYSEPIDLQKAARIAKGLKIDEFYYVCEEGIKRFLVEE